MSVQLFFSNETNEALLKKEASNVKYYIQDVEFDFELFTKARKDQLSVEEVFSIENMEQRRVAYQLMDKNKIKDLPNLKTLSRVKDDGYGYPMKVIQFERKDYKKPFRFLNCFCPTTGREYYLETDKTNCWEAKWSSFGLKNKRKLSSIKEY